MASNYLLIISNQFRLYKFPLQSCVWKAREYIFDLHILIYFLSGGWIVSLMPLMFLYWVQLQKRWKFVFKCYLNNLEYGYFPNFSTTSLNVLVLTSQIDLKKHSLDNRRSTDLMTPGNLIRTRPRSGCNLALSIDTNLKRTGAPGETPSAIVALLLNTTRPLVVALSSRNTAWYGGGGVCMFVFFIYSAGVAIINVLFYNLTIHSSLLWLFARRLSVEARPALNPIRRLQIVINR